MDGTLEAFGVLLQLVQGQPRPDLRAIAGESAGQFLLFVRFHGAQHAQGAVQRFFGTRYGVSTAVPGFMQMAGQRHDHAAQAEIQIRRQRLHLPAGTIHLGRDPGDRAIFAMHHKAQQTFHRLGRQLAPTLIEPIRMGMPGGITACRAIVLRFLVGEIQMRGDERAAHRQLFQFQAHRAPIGHGLVDARARQRRGENGHVAVAQIVDLGSDFRRCRWRLRHHRCIARQQVARAFDRLGFVVQRCGVP